MPRRRRVCCSTRTVTVARFPQPAANSDIEPPPTGPRPACSLRLELPTWASGCAGLSLRGGGVLRPLIMYRSELIPAIPPAAYRRGALAGPPETKNGCGARRTRVF